ncbi:unnamed protein product, partial [Porites lobata]
NRELKHQTFSTGRRQPEVKFTSDPRFPPTESAVATLRRLCFAYFDVACKTLYSVKMATKKQPVMEWTDDHDILLLREMIATEFFQEDSFSAKDKKKSDDKEAAEEIRKKAMERMKRKSTESAGGSAKKSRRSGGDAVEFLKEKAQSEYSIRQQELELQRKEQEVRARQQELQIELLRKQTEQQVQISQALMTMMQNMVKK